MKALIIILSIIFISGCGYAGKVKSLTDERLCENFGRYSLYAHDEVVHLTKEEIDTRNIDSQHCQDIANSEIDRISPGYKLKLCQNLASYHFKGAYPHFKATLDKIEKAGFADDECNTMADFFLVRLSRKQQKVQAIANALSHASDNMRRTNEQLYGRGSAFNPIHVNIDK